MAPFPEACFILVCLFICSVAWLVYFGDVCFPWSVKVWWPLLRGCSLGSGHGHLDGGGSSRALVTVSFPDCSVELSALCGRL